MTENLDYDPPSYNFNQLINLTTVVAIATCTEYKFRPFVDIATVANI